MRELSHNRRPLREGTCKVKAGGPHPKLILEVGLETARDLGFVFSAQQLSVILRMLVPCTSTVLNSSVLRTVLYYSIE